MTFEPIYNNEPIKSEFHWFTIISLVVVILGGLFFVISVFLYQFSKPPDNFPIHSSITIAPGESVSRIVELFKDGGYVRSADLLYAVLILEHDTTDIRAGVYTFSEKLSTRQLARVMTEIGPQEPLISLTFPEGITVNQFANIADKKLPQFNKESFLAYATDYEGSLFPDTYFVPETYTDENLFDLLRVTFDEKIAPMKDTINLHTLTLPEIIILASIIEREANSRSSMELVASVLLNRLAIDMPLQADASIEYVLDKPLSELVPEDLKIDSPYNTYLYTGLPPTPIGNPGLDAIGAIVAPVDSNYFYYITDNNGEFHFAETFAEHKENIARYLR